MKASDSKELDCGGYLKTAAAQFSVLLIKKRWRRWLDLWCGLSKFWVG